MSHDLFLYILRCLHFNKDDDNPGDLLHKVQPLVGDFNNTMTMIYYPGKDLSLDKAMDGAVQESSAIPPVCHRQVP